MSRIFKLIAVSLAVASHLLISSAADAQEYTPAERTLQEFISQLSDLKATEPPKGHGGSVEKKRACSTTSSTSKISSYVCVLQTEKCCDWVKDCAQPVDGSPPICRWVVSNCKSGIKGFGCNNKKAVK